jgi:hypothetical protein
MKQVGRGSDGGMRRRHLCAGPFDRNMGFCSIGQNKDVKLDTVTFDVAENFQCLPFKRMPGAKNTDFVGKVEVGSL